MWRWQLPECIRSAIKLRFVLILSIFSATKIKISMSFAYTYFSFILHIQLMYLNVIWTMLGQCRFYGLVISSFLFGNILANFLRHLTLLKVTMALSGYLNLKHMQMPSWLFLLGACPFYCLMITLTTCITIVVGWAFWDYGTYMNMKCVLTRTKWRCLNFFGI